MYYPLFQSGPYFCPHSLVHVGGHSLISSKCVNSAQPSRYHHNEAIPILLYFLLLFLWIYFFTFVSEAIIINSFIIVTSVDLLSQLLWVPRRLRWCFSFGLSPLSSPVARKSGFSIRVTVFAWGVTWIKCRTSNIHMLESQRITARVSKEGFFFNLKILNLSLIPSVIRDKVKWR